MKNLLILLAIPLFLISCVRDNDGDNKIGETVSLNLELDLNLSLKKSDETNKGVGLTNKFSEFQHIFKDEVDLVFTSTTTTFSTTLTITPNDLSNTPTLVIPYGTYSWSILDNEQDGNVDYFLRSYLPIYGNGSVEIYSSEVSIDLLVDTNFGLVTVEKENISSAKISLGDWEKNLILEGDYFYLYALQSDGYQLSIDESVYNTTITRYIDSPNILYAKTHYNYILAFSDVDVNSISIKSSPFTQYDFYLQPTATLSSTCSLSLSPYQSQSYLTQTVSATSSIQTVTFSTSTTCSETINYSVSGLPAGVSMDIIELTYPRISGTVSSSVSSGTYNYTITAFNSTSSSTATVSATATGTIIVSNTNSNTNESGSLEFNNDDEVNFVGVGNAILTSDDGLTWSTRTSPTNAFLRDVIYVNNLWIAVGNDGTILTSQNGKNWTERSSGSDAALIRITYGNQKYVVSGQSGTILTSTDAINWTASDTNISYDLSGLVYGKQQFIAAPWGNGNSGSPFLTSTNGDSWTQVAHNLTDNDNAFNSNERLVEDIAFGNNVFVGVGIYGRIIKSTDGINWFSVSTSVVNQNLGGNGGSLYNLDFINGKFVAVGGGMDTNSLALIMTSSDGENWSKKNNDLTSTQWARFFSITYGNGLYVVSGNKSGNDPGTVVLTSQDGENWTTNLLYEGSNYNIFDLAYKNQ